MPSVGINQFTRDGKKKMEYLLMQSDKIRARHGLYDNLGMVKLKDYDEAMNETWDKIDALIADESTDATRDQADRERRESSIVSGSLQTFGCGTHKTHCFHSGAVMSIVGEGPKLVIDFENYRSGQDSVSKDEGEQNVAKRLLADVVSVHKKLIDVVVYDALACNSVWSNHCIKHGVDAVVRMKNNNKSSIKEVKKRVNKSEIVEVWTEEKGFEKIEVYESLFTMDKVLESLRFVKDEN